MNDLLLRLPIKHFVVIGSMALGIREAKDIDIVCYKSDIQTEWLEKDNFSGYFDFEGRRIEILLADEQESFQYILSRGLVKRIATVEELYAIKRGHAMFPTKNWEKHMFDMTYLKKLLDYGNRLVNTELINLHKKSTEYRLGKQKLPKLKGVSKELFFDDKVVKFYEHDDIHQIFAHKEKAMYTYMQRDPNSVQCDKDLWLKFSYEDQLHCVMEECYTIASERKLIPTMKGVALFVKSHEAFKWALMRCCTNLCSGFFRNFAIDNYLQILHNYNCEYSKKLELLNNYDNEEKRS